MKLVLASTTAVIALALPGTACAQTVNSASTQPTLSTERSPAPVDGVGLEEIVVTAQKRSENLQAVPIAINAASGEQLAARGIANTMELSILSPGLTINETVGAFQPSLRGIGTSSGVNENPVALYIDGVYIPQQRDGLREFEDVEQIAVLKGPQGTLFGRNATAGVIQITTKKPSFDFGGKFRVEVDNYETVRLGGYVTGGLSNNIAMSLSANYTTQGQGWGKNLTTGSDIFKIDHDAQVRGKILFNIGDSTSLTLAGDYIDWQRDMAYIIPLPGTRFPAFISPNPYVTAPLNSVYDSYSAFKNFVALKGGGGSLTIDHESDAVRLVSITAYRHVTASQLSDAVPVGVTFLRSNSPKAPSRSYSQEFQVISNAGGPLNWMFGLYYFNYDNEYAPLTRTFGGILVSPVTQVVQRLTFATENTESIAPFGEFNWEFMPETRVNGGIRYTYERKTLRDARDVAVTSSGGMTPTFFQGNIHYSEPTFRIGLDHKFSNRFMAYATFNTGFKSGGFNIGSLAAPPYQPEKLKAYEVGIKSELFDRKLRFNIAAFYYDYTNLQVVQYINLIQTVTNGPKAKIYGVDVDFDARLFEGFKLSGGFELKHSEFTSYPNAVFGILGAGGVGASLAPGNATGNRLPQAQNFSGTIAADYHHDLSAGSLDFNATANYNGDFYFQADNAVRQKPYTIVNAAATWNLPGDHWSLKIWGKNLLDQQYITVALETTFGFLSGYNVAPRTVGGTVSYKF